MFTLFIDESGKNFLRSVEANRPHFSLGGVVIKNTERNQIKIKADQIKYKYWGRTDIVFHTTELISLKGPFSIFRRGLIKLTIDDFYTDFIAFLREADFRLTLFCMNRLQYIMQNNLEVQIEKFHSNDRVAQKLIKGTEEGIIDKYGTNILVAFLHFLKDNKASGQVVIEATGTPQDLFVFKAYNRLLSHGYSGFKMSGEGIRNHFTSVAFVTKNNHDIETQLADCASSFLTKNEREIDGIEKVTLPHQQEIIAILKAKSFQFADGDSGLLKDSIQREC